MENRSRRRRGFVARAPLKGGRPCRLTIRIALELVKLIRNGNDCDVAARLAGIGTDTFRRWRRAGRAGDPRFVLLVEVLEEA
jgi:hypothetical protein